MTSYCLPDSQGDTLANPIETTDKPYTLIAPRLSATQDPTLIQFIETHFDALCPHLNWFTVELFFLRATQYILKKTTYHTSNSRS